MNNTSTVCGGDVVSNKDLPRIRLVFLIICVVIPQTVIAHTIKIFTHNGGLDCFLRSCGILVSEVLGVVTEKINCNQVISFTTCSTIGCTVRPCGNNGIVNLWPNRESRVGGQSPWGGRPCQGSNSSQTQGCCLLSHQGECDRHGLVLTHLVDVIIHTEFMVGQRRFIVPAIRKNAEAFICQALVVKTLECPDDGLHEGDIQRLIVIFEVDPACLTGYILFPFSGVAKDRGASFCVERSNTHLFNFFFLGDPQLTHSFQLRRETVGVPTKATVHFLTTHGLVAREQVFGVASEKVTVVRKTIGKRRAVIKDPLVPIGTLFYGCLEGVVFFPKGQNLLFDGRERWRRNDLSLLTECITAGIRHLGLQLLRKTLCQDEISSAVPPDLVRQISPLVLEQ